MASVGSREPGSACARPASAARRRRSPWSSCSTSVRARSCAPAAWAPSIPRFPSAASWPSRVPYATPDQHASMRPSPGPRTRHVTPRRRRGRCRERLGISVRGATVMSTDSYYLGQGRPTRADGDSDRQWIAQARGRGAQGFDMETETVLAVAENLGARAAAILAVHANRSNLRWLENYEERRGPRRAPGGAHSRRGLLEGGAIRVKRSSSSARHSPMKLDQEATTCERGSRPSRYPFFCSVPSASRSRISPASPSRSTARPSRITHPCSWRNTSGTSPTPASKSRSSTPARPTS